MLVMIRRCVAALLCMLIISVSSGTVYVQSGSDITDCNMKCPQDDVTVELYRVCRGEDRTLLENHCYFNFTKSHDPRIQLHTGSGCWKLTSARKDDSCVYKMWCHCAPGYVISSTEIRVLDPVLISNITSNFSRLGEDMAVSVHFSGEESAVTWEVDGEPLPERYRLIDDNRTLIIPSVQRDDTKRRFQVRITNPISEEIREYQLILNPTFRKLLATEDPDPFRRKHLFVIAAAVLVLLIFCCITAYQMHENMIPEDPLPKDIMNVSVPVMEIGYVSNMENQFLSTMKKGPVPILEMGSMPIMGNVSGTTMENEPLSTIYKGYIPDLVNGSELIQKMDV